MGWEVELILRILPRRNSLDEREWIPFTDRPDKFVFHNLFQIPIYNKNRSGVKGLSRPTPF